MHQNWPLNPFHPCHNHHLWPMASSLSSKARLHWHQHNTKIENLHEYCMQKKKIPYSSMNSMIYLTWCASIPSSILVRRRAANSLRSFHLSIRLLILVPISALAPCPLLTRSCPVAQIASQRGQRPCISASRAYDIKSIEMWLTIFDKGYLIQWRVDFFVFFRTSCFFRSSMAALRSFPVLVERQLSILSCAHRSSSSASCRNW